ncbi:hypothetical protein SUDANB145_06876 [Streptomyces sp. enrichment culture]
MAMCGPFLSDAGRTARTRPGRNATPAVPPAAGPPEPEPRGGSAGPGVRSTTGALPAPAHTRRRAHRSTPRADGPDRPASGNSLIPSHRTARGADVRRGHGTLTDLAENRHEHGGARPTTDTSAGGARLGPDTSTGGPRLRTEHEHGGARPRTDLITMAPAENRHEHGGVRPTPDTSTAAPARHGATAPA